MERAIRLAALLGYLGSGAVLVHGITGACAGLAGPYTPLGVVKFLPMASSGALGVLGAKLIAGQELRSGAILLLLSALLPLWVGISTWAISPWLQLFCIAGVLMLGAALVALWAAAKGH